MRRYFIAGFLAVTMLGGCTYDVKTTASPALNVYSSYTDKLPGKFAVVVDSSLLTRTVEPSSHNCSAHEYPIDARDAFKDSTIATITQLVETAEAVPAALTADQLQDGAYRGQVTVKAEEYNPRLSFIPGFWTASASSTVDISASLVVDGPDGRLLGTKATESRTVDAGSSAGCGAGVDALAQANAKATQAVLERLGERLSSDPRLRAAAAP